MSYISNRSPSGNVNLGIYSADALAKQANDKSVNLPLKEQYKVEVQLSTLKKILAAPPLPVGPNDKKSLDEFLARLIEDKESEDHAAFLISMMVPPANIDKITIHSLQQEAIQVNDLALFITFMRKNFVSIEQIDAKIMKNQRLDYAECYLIDQLYRIGDFAESLYKAGITNNPRLNQVREILRFAENHAFSEFQNGDLLFYDLEGTKYYYGQTLDVADKVTILALGTRYAHVGIFYRDQHNKPCVTHIQGQHSRQFLRFGMQSFIRGKRIDPSKLTEENLTPEEKEQLQKKLGSDLSATTSNNWKIGITLSQQLGSVFGHKTSQANTLLGRVKLRNDTNLLCSEFAATGIMEVFHTFNQSNYQISGKKITLINPFDPKEDLTSMHPERLLVGFGPAQGTAKAASAWQDVVPPEVKEKEAGIAALLPVKPPFPEVSYLK